jgi:hypothetical protein
MSATFASLQRARKAISAAKAFESAGQDLLRTGGDQDKPKVPLPKGTPIPKRPQQRSAGIDPAGQGYPDNQPHSPGTQPAPFDGQYPYRPAGPPYQPERSFSDPYPGDQRHGESAGYYSDHPQRSQTQSGHQPTPSGYFQPSSYPPGQSQYSQRAPIQDPQVPSQYSQQEYRSSPPQQQQQQQRSMQDPFSPPDQYSQGFQSHPPRQRSMQEEPYSYHQSRGTPQPASLQGTFPWPQTAEPATFPSSPNPQQGNCLSCGHQRFLNP